MDKEQELQIYIDGEFYPKSQAKVSVYDHGFLYGDGVFEGIRVYNGVVFKLKEHVQRLVRFRACHAAADSPHERADDESSGGHICARTTSKTLTYA